MDLLLIRHALPVRVEGAEGPADPALSDIGWDQSRALADWLAHESIDTLYTSPLKRAIETAVPIVDVLGLSPVIEDGIAEYDRHSDSYVPLEELKAEGDPRWLEMVEGGYWDDEHMSADEFRDVVVDAVDRIIYDNAGATVAVVCHGGVINAYLGHVLGLDDLMFFEPTYTGVSRVKASRRGHRMIASVNETAHSSAGSDLVKLDPPVKIGHDRPVIDLRGNT